MGEALNHAIREVLRCADELTDGTEVLVDGRGRPYAVNVDISLWEALADAVTNAQEHREGPGAISQLADTAAAERDALRKALERAKAYIGALPGTDDAIAAYEDIRQALTGAPDHE